MNLMTGWRCAMLATVALWAFAATGATVAEASPPLANQDHDEFFWLGEINKASTVMLVEQSVVSKPLGQTIARAIEKVVADGDVRGGSRPGVDQYLQLEALMVAAGGPEVTRVHSGRSRQDLRATVNRIQLREHSLQRECPNFCV
jgi:argininosuccinate lyase